jgi:hypothetical protein
MRKFGRPDVVAICSEREVNVAAEVVWQVASGMALGFMPQLPRHGIDISESESWYLIADAGDSFAIRLGLNNDARILVDANGQWLVRSSG